MDRKKDKVWLMFIMGIPLVTAGFAMLLKTGALKGGAYDALAQVPGSGAGIALGFIGILLFVGARLLLWRIERRRRSKAK